MTMALQRTVLVVGRTAREPTQLFPDDVDGSIALVVIALGWPLSDTQQLSAADGVESVAARDRVLLVCGRREARRIERSLRTRGISARVAR